MGVDVLLLKLALSPLLIAAATLGARRWGPAAGGWAASLPVVGGPVLLVVAVQHGDRFGADAARSATAGLLSLAVFGAVYARLARRRWGWARALAMGWFAFLLVTAALAPAHVPVLLALLPLGLVSGQAQRLVGVGYGETTPGAVPRGDLLARMAAGAAMVLGLSAVSSRLGSHLTGLVAPFPVIASVLAVFTHRQLGSVATSRYAVALLRGLPSFGLFTAVVATALTRWGAAGTFVAATAAALATHGVLLWLQGGMAPHAVPRSAGASIPPDSSRR